MVKKIEARAATAKKMKPRRVYSANALVAPNASENSSCTKCERVFGGDGGGEGGGWQLGRGELEGDCSKTRTPRGQILRNKSRMFPAFTATSELIGTSKLQPHHFYADQSFEVFSASTFSCIFEITKGLIYASSFTFEARGANSMISNTKLARLLKLLHIGGRRVPGAGGKK